MHMADALISPAVGGAMWAISGGLAAYSAQRVRAEANEQKAPLMGVIAAFVFTAQMINFTLPATGSSGHLGGGMLLAILLGPYAAFLALFSVLAIQALFFADGGLLALGCNVFNLGVWTCFVAYPLIYRGIVGAQPTQARLAVGATLAAIVGLQLGAFSVVLETLASGIAELPFGTFVLLMQPIHLAIGIVEGLVTAAIVTFVWKARPEVLQSAQSAQNIGLRPVLLGLLGAAVITGGALSWLASEHPDGLEWALRKTSGKAELPAPKDCIRASLAEVQQETAFLPDYDFRKRDAPAAKADAEPWPAVSAGTSVAGLLGGLAVLTMAGLIGLALRRAQANA